LYGIQLIIVSASWIAIEKLLWMSRDHKKRLDATKSKLLLRTLIFEKITKVSPGALKEFSEG